MCCDGRWAETYMVHTTSGRDHCGGGHLAKLPTLLWTWPPNGEKVGFLSLCYLQLNLLVPGRYEKILKTKLFMQFFIMISGKFLVELQFQGCLGTPINISLDFGAIRHNELNFRWKYSTNLIYIKLLMSVSLCSFAGWTDTALSVGIHKCRR